MWNSHFTFVKKNIIYLNYNIIIFLQKYLITQTLKYQNLITRQIVMRITRCSNCVTLKIENALLTTILIRVCISMSLNLYKKYKLFDVRDNLITALTRGSRRTKWDEWTTQEIIFSGFQNLICKCNEFLKKIFTWKMAAVLKP